MPPIRCCRLLTILAARAGPPAKGTEANRLKRFAMMLLSGVFVAASLRCGAESACGKVTVEASVEAGQGELTLADLLGGGTCPLLRQAAAQLNLGTVPRAGSVRVLDGRRVRLLIESLANHELADNLLTNHLANHRLTNHAEPSEKEAASIEIPERIVVQRAGATKSCAEIARFVASAAPAQDMAGAPGRLGQNLDCAAIRGIPEGAPLQLTRTKWNPALRRWEFGLRCARPEECVPFLVSAHVVDAQSRRASPAFLAESSARVPIKAGASGAKRLINTGQTAILTWDQGGIRVVLPVTCLDGGELGEFVRVRFKNAAGTLRAEVVGEGTLRAAR